MSARQTVKAARARLAEIARAVDAKPVGEMVYSSTTDFASGDRVIRCIPRCGAYGRYDNRNRM